MSTIATAVPTALGSQDTWIKRFALVPSTSGDAIILDLHDGTKHVITVEESKHIGSGDPQVDAARECELKNQALDAPIRKIIDDALEEEFSSYTSLSKYDAAGWSYQTNSAFMTTVYNTAGDFVITLSRWEAMMMVQAYVYSRILQQHMRQRAAKG